MKLSAKGGFGKTDSGFVQNVVAISFEVGVRLQSYPDIEISTAPALSSVPLSPDAEALTFVSSRGNFHLELGP